MVAILGSMTTNVSAKGLVTLPEAVREAAGICPGDRVTVRARPEGGVLIERDNQDQRPSWPGLTRPPTR
jgi:AbrB family looped-hinge helix DNA binding protein